MDEHKPKWRYDVFLCFRGEDTRFSFTGNLYKALTHKKFKTFMDHEGLKTGDHINYIHQALQESRIAIVVLSKDFASSSFCLDEILAILEWKETKNQLVLPIFYDVDPSDVSCDDREGETSKFKQDLISHFENRFERTKLQTWMSALSHFAQLAPLYPWLQFNRIQKQYESERIEKIVQWVTKKVPRCNIFLSFRGKDSRYPFIDFLCDALRSERFIVNMHDEASENDDDRISESLVQAIEKSWLSVAVLSENYAHSSSCLDELHTILESKKRKNQRVWPIFYKVEPSELRDRTNSYGNAMAQHANRFEEDEVNKWCSALFQVASMKGSHLKTGYEYEIIEKIVKGAINAMYKSLMEVGG